MKKAWILGIYTSGGSAHERAMQELCRKQKGIKPFNLLNSTCTFFPLMGRLFSWGWDQSQRKGNVKGQILLGRLQQLAERLFFLPTYLTLRKLLSKHSSPEKLLVTCPLFFGAVCRAAFKAKVSAVHLYMVEPPTEDAGYYFNSIKRLPVKEKKLLKLYAQHPMKEDLDFYGGEESYWYKKTGLGMDQILFDPPVKEVFKNACFALPYPGQQISFVLEGYLEPFFIASQDRVGLIMLGGVPTIQALYDYLDLVIALANDQIITYKNFLFLACGQPQLGLYEKMRVRLKEYKIPSHLQVVPFSNQPVEQIFGRADFTITRSGGMTSLEILELKKREKDDKLILIHAQTPRGFSGSEEELISQGIPLWEGGNARYLQKTIPGARIVTPQNARSYIAKKFYS